MNNETRKNIVIGAGCLAIGTGAGYLIARKQLEKYYQELAQKEIDEARETFRALRKADMPTLSVVPDIEETFDTYDGSEEPSTDEPEPIDEQEVDRFRDKVVDLKYWTPPKETEAVREIREKIDQELAEEAEASEEDPANETGEEETTVNIFDQQAPSGAELGEPLNKDAPYIISEEEFFDTEDFNKLTYSYYDDDEILTNEQDERVYDVDAIVGSKNLIFGEDTVVYIRNPRLESDYEVTLEMGSYAEARQGIVREPRGRRG